MPHSPVQDCDCYACNDARRRDAHHKAVISTQKAHAAERAKNLAFPAAFIERHGGKEATVKLDVKAPDGTGLGYMAVFPDGAFCHPSGQMMFKEDFGTPKEKAWQAALVLAYCEAKARAGTREFTQRKAALAAAPYYTDEAITGLEAFAEKVKAWKRKAKVAKIMHQRAKDRATYPGLSLSEIAAKKKEFREHQEYQEAARLQYQGQQASRISAINLVVDDTPKDETESEPEAVADK